MVYEVLRMTPAFLDGEWPKVRGYLENALRHTDELNIDQLRMQATRGEVTLFAVFKEGILCGCFAVEDAQYPNYRVANVVAAGGKMICNEQFWKVFSAWLKSLGYSKVQCYCRPSVARMINRIQGFKTTYQVLRCDL